MRPVPTVRSHLPEAVTVVGICVKRGHPHLVQPHLDDCCLRDDAKKFEAFWDMENECGVVCVVVWRCATILA